jgi:hypothetical protein
MGSEPTAREEMVQLAVPVAAFTATAEQPVMVVPLAVNARNLFKNDYTRSEGHFGSD